MKRFLIPAIMAVLACSCRPSGMVNAHAVPERADDFVWENDLVCYRAYGQGLEGETLSPGFDMWVKMPGALCADEMYRMDLQDHKSYHKFWGLGKDCYKVGRSLGAGASVLLVENRFQYPQTNWRSCRIIKKTPRMVKFALSYPEWQGDGVRISLEKVITVKAGSRFCKAEDTYTFAGDQDSLYVCAGIARHGIEAQMTGKDRFAIWEHASDTGAEPEDGMLGLAVFMPGADAVSLSRGDDHSVCLRKVASGDTVTYYFGSCWSKAGIGEAQEWFDMVREFKD